MFSSTAPQIPQNIQPPSTAPKRRKKQIGNSGIQAIPVLATAIPIPLNPVHPTPHSPTLEMKLDSLFERMTGFLSEQNVFREITKKNLSNLPWAKLGPSIGCSSTAMSLIELTDLIEPSDLRAVEVKGVKTVRDVVDVGDVGDVGDVVEPVLEIQSERPQTPEP